MDKKTENYFPYNNPYRFDKTSEFLYDRYNSIRSRKKRIEAEKNQGLGPRCQETGNAD